jgi:hypothetical protein
VSLLLVQGPVEVNISGAITEGSDSAAGTLALAITLSGAITEGSDVVAGTLAAVHSISGAIDEGSDVAAGTIDLLIEISGAIEDGADAVSGTIDVEAAAVGHDSGAALRKAAREQRYIYYRAREVPARASEAIERVVEYFEDAPTPSLADAVALLALELDERGVDPAQAYTDLLRDELARMRQAQTIDDDDEINAAIVALL